ncbi:DNA methyltransferase [Cesiribacter sp. SM1]|uniref:DNA methyltransferase n=1 Tax=Cesiribacter sp. SM1 TaxID=2861196 RepID=UPI001CD6460D
MLKHHQHKKPIELMEYLISTFMNRNSNEVVLDAIMGSASTIIAAINCGVNWIGIEKALISLE